jgi:hypothetical protein
MYDSTNIKGQWGDEEILNHRIEITNLLGMRKIILSTSN